MTDARPLDPAALYAALRERARERGDYHALDDEQRAEYHAKAVAEGKARRQAAKAAGSPELGLAEIRDALADAAARILAEGGPGADVVREVVAAHFPTRSAATSHVEALARLGKLRRRRRKST